MDLVLGTTLPVYGGLSVAVMGGLAYLVGRTAAERWQSAWSLVPNILLLTVANRFLIYALFAGRMTAPGGFAVDVALFATIMITAHRAAARRKFSRQYPWLSVRAGAADGPDREDVRRAS